MDEVNFTVIGAGVVGLAVAAELSKRHPGVLVLEKHPSYGRETSSRSSEVIHAGIYYPRDSLKGQLCREGSPLLYDCCRIFDIPHRKLGKVIIATQPEERAMLEDLCFRGQANGVEDLVLLDKRDLHRLEPNTNGVAALYSPHTGIVDSHALMRHWYQIAVAQGAIFAFNTEVVGIWREKDHYEVGIRQDHYRFRTQVVINAAGLWSDRIAGLAGIDLEKAGYRIRLCKGSYFCSQRPSSIKMLVYPVPQEELVGLGVHATLDMANRLRFGPDVEYVNMIDYSVDEAKKDLFFTGAVKIVPGLDREAFCPDMAGIRPKLQGPGEAIRDFVIAEESAKGLPGFINLIGIESPGLTASPAIAKKVADLVSCCI